MPLAASMARAAPISATTLCDERGSSGVSTTTNTSAPTSRFPFGRRASVEIMAEVLNVFDTISFNHNVDFDDGEDTFRVTTA